jgi:hypothetical protein
MSCNLDSTIMKLGKKARKPYACSSSSRNMGLASVEDGHTLKSNGKDIQSEGWWAL